METYYEPTSEDLRDWARHCAEVAAGVRSLGERADEATAEALRFAEHFPDNLDGDHESAPSSVFGPND